MSNETILNFLDADKSADELLDPREDDETDDEGESYKELHKDDLEQNDKWDDMQYSMR